MVNLTDFRADIVGEVSTILASDFTISVTNTTTVPHSNDAAITFPNLDQKNQGTKVIETAVLYIDMRRSTELSLQHRPHVVAKLYSAFVRAMTRCANVYGGEVRGIIGDRVMVLFNKADCFGQAIDTAILMHSVCKYVIDKHFSHNAVEFGIGIDYGRMLATKTGIRKHNNDRQNYRSLVWLGRPANIASKLTDIANKAEDAFDITLMNVAYDYLGTGFLSYAEEWPHEFVQNFYLNSGTGQMHHVNPAFRSFSTFKRRHVRREATPPILMTEKFYKGLVAARPNDDAIKNGWFKKINASIKESNTAIYGGDVHFKVFKQ